MAEIFEDIDDIESVQRLVIKEVLYPLVSQATRRSLGPKTVVDFDPAMIWLVDSGRLYLECRGRSVLDFEAEDILGPWLSSVAGLSLATKDAACELVGFSKDLIVAGLGDDDKLIALWCSYQMALTAGLFARFAELKSIVAQPTPEYRHYAPGDTILSEGEVGRDVYILTGGAAVVMVKGSRVGEIHKEEVFGALATLSEGMRTATVVATEPCDCMVFNRHDFQDLLRVNPKLMAKLFEDFGRALHDLNDSMLRASSTKWRHLF